MPARRRSITRSLAIALVAAAACLPGAARAAEVRPADDRFAQQWAMQRGGPLDAPEAWTMSTGTGQVVAVLDSGVDLGHRDLRDALWTNPGEVPGNGIDDDDNGYVDDVHGADIVDGDGDPEDSEGHGTHVAGIIAAQLNGVGVVGLAPGAKVMPVRVVAGKRGSAADVARGVTYAIAEGATIINISLAADGEDTDLEDALAAAEQAGVLVVASAGNGARNLDLFPAWPAAIPSVIAAAASDESSLLAVFSNFGARTVDVAAPGTSILSTARGGGYELRDGTSMAAPEVAATLALLRSAAPDRSPSEIRALLRATAVKPSGLAALLSAGRIDPVAALREIAPAQAAASLRLSARARRRSKTRALVTWSVLGDGAAIGSYRVSVVGGRTLATRRAGARGVWVSRRLGRVRVSARDGAGKTLASATVRLG